MMKVIFSKQQRKPPLRNRRLLLQAIQKTVELVNLHEDNDTPEKVFYLNVILLGKSEIIELNRTFLGHDNSTDVIAFDLREKEPTSEEENMLGEIYICLDVAVEAAAAYDTSVGNEVVLYIVHGMLHLKGYDDHDADSRRQMRLLENRIMKRLKQQFPVDSLFLQIEDG